MHTPYGNSPQFYSHIEELGNDLGLIGPRFSDPMFPSTCSKLLTAEPRFLRPQRWQQTP